MDIRPARREDVPAILELIGALAEYEHLTHQVVATATALEEALFGDRPAAEAALAWEEGASPVGFALWFHGFSTFQAKRTLYLEDLFVVPAARGRGVGRALLQHVARLATSRGCGRFEWAVLDWNAPAIRFYEAMGATVLPDWRICRVTGDALERLARPAR